LHEYIKKILKLIGVLIFYIVVVLFVLQIYLPREDAPQVRYGEFPFKLEYEINGEYYCVEDILVCEFDGFEYSLGQGMSVRTWKVYTKGTGEPVVVLLEPDEDTTIYFAVGGSWHYMGDYRNSPTPTTPSSFPDAHVEYRRSDGGTSGGYFEADELYERYAIKLLNFEHAQPIENSFEPVVGIVDLMQEGGSKSPFFVIPADEKESPQEL